MVTVKYFGALREYAKVNEEQFSFDGLALRQIVDEIKEKYQLHQTTFSVAVNQKMIVDLEDYVVKSDDILAFLPPFSGG